jgi:hypothetical protein
MRDNIYEEVYVLDQFPKYCVKILLDVNAKVGRENIFKQLGMRVYKKLMMMGLEF